MWCKITTFVTNKDLKLKTICKQKQKNLKN